MYWLEREGQRGLTEGKLGGERKPCTKKEINGDLTSFSVLSVEEQKNWKNKFNKRICIQVNLILDLTFKPW